MRIRRSTYVPFKLWPQRSRARAAGAHGPSVWFWLWWAFKPDPEPILTRLQNSRWRPVVLVPYKAWMLVRRQTTCRLGWHLWSFAYGNLVGTYRYCEACDLDDVPPVSIRVEARPRGAETLDKKVTFIELNRLLQDIIDNTNPADADRLVITIEWRKGPLPAKYGPIKKTFERKAT